ncbi:hypothetical protein BVI2075_110135 [Burkholderia vietnamiensis]|nr:hypothetical protein BVI2075_110135 [Burkholderia vietnamiensis]
MTRVRTFRARHTIAAVEKNYGVC